VALLALPHGHARAVPEPLLGLRLLVVVVPARAQRRAQRLLVLRKPLPKARGSSVGRALGCEPRRWSVFAAPDKHNASALICGTSLAVLSRWPIW
jgi:hypothetical protein